MKQEKLIRRYNSAERINHWFVAICFIVLALSGLAFVYPAFFWFTGVLGTPQLARIIHPFVGVLFFIGFAVEFFRYYRFNLPDQEDIKWIKSLKAVLQGKEPADTGRYNAGQKGMFWLMTLCSLVLIITGVIMWRPWFAGNFPIPLIRLALLFHASSALLLIIGIITHVYAAIWVKGTLPAMIEGVVTKAWAKSHHPRWYREVMKKEQEPPGK